MKYEWKKEEKNIYQSIASPILINIPKFSFFKISGKGNPNDGIFGEYISVLYSLSYAVKMLPKSGVIPEGYFDYVVYPLEGVWDITKSAKETLNYSLNKDDLVYDLMIRQPSFVTPILAQRVVASVLHEKPHPLLKEVIFEEQEEGCCVQMLHKGSFDDEYRSFEKTNAFCSQNRLIRTSKMHREIYLSDARKVAPEKLKTILRVQVVESYV